MSLSRVSDHPINNPLRPLSSFSALALSVCPPVRPSISLSLALPRPVSLVCLLSTRFDFSKLLEIMSLSITRCVFSFVVSVLAGEVKIVG